MRKYYRRIVFTKTPLKSQFRYLDKFQILPIDSLNAPSSPYNDHFPLFLEYFIEFDEDQSPKDIDIFDDLSAQQVVEYEIINILSVLSNHHFFKYKTASNQWAITTPNIGFDNLSPEQKIAFNNQFSTWTFSGYIFPGLKDELEIESFTEFKFPPTPLISNYYHYFTHDPIDNKESEISFPATIVNCLDNYYSLSSKTFKKIKSSLSLICDGLDISDSKRSLAFLSFVSAIEAFVGLEFSDKEVEFECNSCKTIQNSPYLCPDCGRPIWGIKTKFKEFLRKFVAGSERSVSTYNSIYNLRCKIAHQGQLFIGDYELSLNNMEKKGNDWLMKLKTLQLARISLTNWLRYEEKASR